MRDSRADLRSPLMEQEVRQHVGDMPLEDLGGNANLNLLVCGSRPYVVRVHRPGMTRARVLALRELRRQLRAHCILVPIPLPLAGSDVVRAGDRWMEAESHEPHSRPTSAHHRELVTALAGLHRAMESCWPASWPAADLPMYASVDHLRKWARGVGPDIRSKRPWNGYVARMESVISRYESAERGLVTSVRSVPLHGDYSAGNVGFAGSGEPVFFDFDTARTGPRIQEVASAAVRFADDSTGSGARASERTALMWRMIEEYEHGAEVPLTTIEWSALPVEASRVELCLAVRRWFRSGAATAWEHLERGLRTAERALS
ncbi:MAG: phosphotransferase enzyme family protein [Actinopolymorphaceae bacterium]